MLAAGRKTLTEVFDLTFIPLLAGSTGAHTHTQTRTILNLLFLAACLNKPPQHGNAFFTQRPLISERAVLHSFRMWLHPQAFISRVYVYVSVI